MVKILDNNRVEFGGKIYDQRHGSAFDRGAADSYYWRPRSPHYYVGPSYMSDRVEAVEGSSEWEAYMAGYDFNEQHGDKKDWGR